MKDWQGIVSVFPLRCILFLSFVLSSLLVVNVQADTVAYWRFEEGPAGALVPAGEVGGIGVLDSSGNGNELYAFSEENPYACLYNSNIESLLIPQLNIVNSFSVKGSDAQPAMMSNSAYSSPSGVDIDTWTPTEFTIEASFMPEANYWYRTIVGRDAVNVADFNGELAAMYFQILPGNAVAIKFADVSGYWHEAISEGGLIQTYDWPNVESGHWYNMAGVFDGTYLSLYLDDVDAGNGYQLVSQIDVTESNSPDTRMTAGNGESGANWHAGSFSIARGFYNGGIVDFEKGFIDEVRISDVALDPSEFLFSEPVSNEETIAYWRFEDGEADGLVPSTADISIGDSGVKDYSGNGNDLFALTSGGVNGYSYNSDVEVDTLPQSLHPNILGVKNTGDQPVMMTDSLYSQPTGVDITTWSSSVFTIEASFKPEDSTGHRTILGRDGYGVTGDGAALAALYLQVMPDNAVAIKYADVSGYWHQAISDGGLIQMYDTGNPESGIWYNIAAVCDGTYLSLYLDDTSSDNGYQLVRQINLTDSESPDTTMAVGNGTFSVGRGFYNDENVDYFKGYIDEVRISAVAINPLELLFSPSYIAGINIEPQTVVVHEERADTAEILISLEAEPVADVQINITEKNARNQLLFNTQTLVFTVENWDVAQPVVVSAVDNSELGNAEQIVPLAITVSSADENFNAIEVADYNVIVLENECGAWGYLKADLSMDCIVDFEDLAVLAENWLACSDPDQANCLNYLGN